MQLQTALVTELSGSEKGVSLSLSSGQSISAHTADIATGGPLNQRFQGDSHPDCYSQLFGYESDIANKLLSGGHIVSIGANAAMLDLLRYCQSILPENKFRLTAVSPSGQVPQALIPSSTRKQCSFKLSSPYQTATEFLADLDSLKKNALADGDSLEEIRSGLRGLFMATSLTDFLPDVNEARKVAKPLYKNFQGGTRDSISDFNRLMTTGSIKILTASVERIEEASGKPAVVFNTADSVEKHLRADVVVNCAGPGYNSTFDVLTNTMIQRNIISLCPYSGGVVVGENANTTIPGVRFLNPAVTMMGDIPEPIPFYDALRLRIKIQQLNNTD